MASPSRFHRPTLVGTLLASLVATSACGLIWPSSSSTNLKRLYVSDYQLNVTARQIAGTSSKEFEDSKIAYLRALGNIGLTYSPNYIFVADPEIVLSATSPVELPSDQVVAEPAGFSDTGELITETVLRKPLFTIDTTTLTYNVPGYTIAPVTLTQGIPIKANSYRLKLPGASQVAELQAAFSANPAKAPAITGSVDVVCNVTDLDPLARDHTFTVARRLPLVYSYSPFTPETTASSEPAPVVILTVPPTTPPPASPSPSPSPTATAGTSVGSISVPIGTTTTDPGATL